MYDFTPASGSQDSARTRGSQDSARTRGSQDSARTRGSQDSARNRGSRAWGAESRQEVAGSQAVWTLDDCHVSGGHPGETQGAGQEHLPGLRRVYLL